MRTLLEPDQIAAGLARIAKEIAARGELSRLVLIGVRRGGLPLVSRLSLLLASESGIQIRTGSVDITLYRDDAATALPNPRIGPSDIPGSLDGARVVLVDDVLYTRRTIRAAIDALMDFGRPANIELMVVVDRAGRQLPIQPDYSILRVEDIGPDERIDVIEQTGELRAIIQDFSAPSIPPPRNPEVVR
ncbi:MAG: hypothetical protein RJA70_3583 [Pseudomonadota bacterium]|jgi:pyrimidine operon attenuation protein/uracil phosphoribosyltransferase